jgi:tRNA threonylcarbamoyladenosine biosynthesis protein TsaB
LQPEPVVLDPEQLRDHAPRGSVAVGDGAVRFRAVLEQFGVVVPPDDHAVHRISPINHCRLAAALDPARRLQDVQPAYLRIPDAEIRKTPKGPNFGDHVAAKVTPRSSG